MLWMQEMQGGWCVLRHRSRRSDPRSLTGAAVTAASHAPPTQPLQELVREEAKVAVATHTEAKAKQVGGWVGLQGACWLAGSDASTA